MADRATRLVIVRHYEPPPEAEMSAILGRVYGRLLGDALLTEPGGAGTIEEEDAQRVDRALEEPESFPT